MQGGMRQMILTALALLAPAVAWADTNTVLRDKQNEWHVRPVASPDGRYLAFASMIFDSNVWMIENF